MRARLVLLALTLAIPTPGGARPEGPKRGLATIRETDLEQHLAELAAPHLEGRDTPSRGLERAAAYIESRWSAAGLVGAGREGSFTSNFVQDLTVPDPDACMLAVTQAESEPEALTLDVDFVPLPGCRGTAQGAPVFVGFGITGSRERWDDLRGVRLEGKVAVLLEGEPRHRRLFDGPEVTEAADVYAKLEELEDAGAVGVLVVRRAPAEEVKGAGGATLAPPTIGYRHSWAHWNEVGGTKPWRDRGSSWDLPVLEISAAAATRIIGRDVVALGRKMDRGGRPLRHEPEGVMVSLGAGFHTAAVSIDNVVGLLPGSDPDVAAEHIVLGAHYDHIGVDPWGRIGYGADDNASGTAALIELAEALAEARPRRSILFAAFAAEEDGLIGARAFCDYPPIALDAMIAMLNMDMLGRGETDEVVVLGTKQNPFFEDVLERARKLQKTGVKHVITGKAGHLWERSDHYAFHLQKIPAMFFFEAVSEQDNLDYHTYRDAIDTVDVAKIANATRMVFNTTWILSEEDERPPPPR